MENRQGTLMEEESSGNARKERNEVSGEPLAIRGRRRKVVRHDDLPELRRYANPRKESDAGP